MAEEKNTIVNNGRTGHKFLRSKALDAHSKPSDVRSKLLDGHPKALNGDLFGAKIHFSIEINKYLWFNDFS